MKFIWLKKHKIMHHFVRNMKKHNAMYCMYPSQGQSY